MRTLNVLLIVSIAAFMAMPVLALECTNSGTAPGTAPDDTEEGNATACGGSAVAEGTESTALGFSASSTGSYSTALGNLASSGGDQSLAAGTLASSAGAVSLALGSGASSTGENMYSGTISSVRAIQTV